MFGEWLLGALSVGAAHTLMVGALSPGTDCFRPSLGSDLEERTIFEKVDARSRPARSKLRKKKSALKWKGEVRPTQIVKEQRSKSSKSSDTIGSSSGTKDSKRTNRSNGKSRSARTSEELRRRSKPSRRSKEGIKQSKRSTRSTGILGKLVADRKIAGTKKQTASTRKRNESRSPLRRSKRIGQTRETNEDNEDDKTAARSTIHEQTGTATTGATEGATTDHEEESSSDSARSNVFLATKEASPSVTVKTPFFHELPARINTSMHKQRLKTDDMAKSRQFETMAKESKKQNENKQPERYRKTKLTTMNERIPSARPTSERRKPSVKKNEEITTSKTPQILTGSKASSNAETFATKPLKESDQKEKERRMKSRRSAHALVSKTCDNNNLGTESISMDADNRREKRKAIVLEKKFEPIIKKDNVIARVVKADLQKKTDRKTKRDLKKEVASNHDIESTGDLPTLESLLRSLHTHTPPSGQERIGKMSAIEKCSILPTVLSRDPVGGLDETHNTLFIAIYQMSLFLLDTLVSPPFVYKIKTNCRFRTRRRQQRISATELQKSLKAIRSKSENSTTTVKCSKEALSTKIQLVPSPSTAQDQTATTEESTINQDSSGCSVPPVPYNSSADSADHIESINENTSDTETGDGNFTTADVVQEERVPTSTVTEQNLKREADEWPNRREQSCFDRETPAASTADNKSQSSSQTPVSNDQSCAHYAVEWQQSSSTLAPSNSSRSGSAERTFNEVLSRHEGSSVQSSDATNSHLLEDDYETLVLSVPACKTLDLIRKYDFFRNTVSDKEKELLCSFFAGKCELNSRVEHVIFRALEKAMVRVQELGPSEDIIQFLYDKNNAATLMFDAMKIRRDYLPAYWTDKASLLEDNEEGHWNRVGFEVLLDKCLGNPTLSTTAFTAFLMKTTDVSHAAVDHLGHL
ncbi:unnamed protein product [Toxocara canis]|uniref:[Histone H3]-lysine(4) N-trimethyltransferase n=1 Tax=Toxocara canis TaxID=6265 RepID=A0A183UPV3_TOXCA|nr:unnamed protein product [Toxocara canis]